MSKFNSLKFKNNLIGNLKNHFDIDWFYDNNEIINIKIFKELGRDIFVFNQKHVIDLVLYYDEFNKLFDFFKKVFAKKINLDFFDIYTNWNDFLNRTLNIEVELFMEDDDYISTLNYLNCKFSKKINIDLLLNEVLVIFELFWDFEFRSSNFGTKMFYFFSVWHTSTTRVSFYDFLLKTKLLQDEENFRIFYDSCLRKRYRKQMNRDRRRLAKFWKVIDGYKQVN